MYLYSFFSIIHFVIQRTSALCIHFLHLSIPLLLSSSHYVWWSSVFVSFKTKPGENIEIFPIIFLHFKIGSNSTLPDIQRNFLPYRMNEWLGNQITEWINTRTFIYDLHLTIWNSCCARNGCFWFKWANEKKTEETTKTISHTNISIDR